MRKKPQKKIKWGMLILTVFLLIGMTSSFVFFGGTGTPAVNYEGIKFKTNGNIWMAKINGVRAAFSFPPPDVQDIKTPEGLQGRINNRLEIDVTYDFNATTAQSIALAIHQMGLTLNEYRVFVRPGTTQNNTYNIPIITCEDSTDAVPVIYFRESNETKIYYQDSCIIAEARHDIEFIRLKDRILYSLLGVMP